MQCCVAEPRYTIEQIALLQRLRLSGMSKPQILHALDSLERLDQEQSHTLPRQPPQCCRNHGNTPATPPTSSSSSLLAPSPSPSPSNEASPPPQGQSFSYDLEEWDVEERVEEYMRRDSSVVKEEIKVFLNNRRISQAIVGQVTGISQSYISQWLLQQGLEMSDPKKRAFYRWYLLERSSPGTTLSVRPLCGPVKEEPEWSGSLGGGVSLRLRRGSRFTWRKECLSVMESFFQENQYPEESKREEIAGACNAVIQKPAGQCPSPSVQLVSAPVSLCAAGSRLSEFEKVTALKVYNWFANRRKEMKRRANIGTLPPAVSSRHCRLRHPRLPFIERHADLTSGNAPQQEPLSLAEQAVTLHSPVLRLANQKAGELKREAVEEEESDLLLLDLQQVHAGDEGWLVFDVATASNRWLLNPRSNLGLRLYVETDEEHSVEPGSVGLVGRKGPRSKQPFMVTFFRQSQPGLRLPRGIRHNRKKHRGRTYDLPHPNKLPGLLDHNHISDGRHVCKRHELYVSFSELGWKDWVIAPQGYSAYYCDGECSYPLGSCMNATNHAIMQLVPDEVPKACCAPTKLSPISVLFYDDNNNVILKKHRNMVVKACGCH
ncbi:Homeobox-containing protein 1 [Acipenser ruthenus]|uniref:Homeobox-containing protein 1 n=1 Tax=Acipenser ruthenus TaxID=7906 RepID=A0A444UZK4_ACIRT|nr:Homeobox-containing protein 1 [Acipenser ruthenus]